MNDDTVKLIRVPADVWRQVVEALENAAVALDDIDGMSDDEDVCERAESAGDAALGAIHAARKVGDV
jgi:hypothetical protein